MDRDSLTPITTNQIASSIQPIQSSHRSRHRHPHRHTRFSKPTFFVSCNKGRSSLSHFLTPSYFLKNPTMASAAETTPSLTPSAMSTKPKAVEKPAPKRKNYLLDLIFRKTHNLTQFLLLCRGIRFKEFPEWRIWWSLHRLGWAPVGFGQGMHSTELGCAI